ncbi:MAG: hypothetical protein HKN26_14750 [Acidimicrobiales bacterium]|nr:hypothetical protein [Acidimicrobiales bacterium]
MDGPRVVGLIFGAATLLAACSWLEDDGVLRPVDVSGGIGYPGGGCVLGDAVYPPIDDSDVFLRGTVSDFAEPVAMVPLLELIQAVKPELDELDEEINLMLFGDEDAVGVIGNGLRYEGRGRADHQDPDLLVLRLRMWQEIMELPPDAEVLVPDLGFPYELADGEVPPLGGRVIEFVNAVFGRDGNAVVPISCDRGTVVDYLDFIAEQNNTTPWLALVGLTNGAYEAIEEPPAPRLVPFGQRGPLGRTFADADTPVGVSGRLIHLTVNIDGEVPEGKVVCARGERAIASCAASEAESFTTQVEANHEVELFVVEPFLRDQAEVEQLDIEARNAVAQEYTAAMQRRVVGPTFFLDRGRDPWTVDVSLLDGGELRLDAGPTR